MHINSGIIQPKRSSESIFENPFYEILRQDFPQLLTESALVAIPCAAALQAIPKSAMATRKFAESHVLVSAHIPHLYCTVRGNAVEQRGDRLITTGVDNSKTVAAIQHSENIYDFGTALKIMVIDRPLMAGDWTPAPLSPMMARNVSSGGGPSEFLSSVPLIEQDFFEKLVKLRRTFLLVPGFESHLSTRVKDLSSLTANQISRYLQPTPPVPTIQADIERAAYATLHTWIYQHVSECVGERKFSHDKSPQHIEKVLREMQAPVSVLAIFRSLLPTIEAETQPLFAKLAQAVTPQQKINYLIQIFSACESLLQSNLKSVGAEELLALLAIAVILAQYTKGIYDVKYMETFLLAHEELSSQNPAFVVTTFSSCNQFLTKVVL